MGWIENPPEPCKHPSRPEPRFGEKRKWQCDDCGKKFRIQNIDYGHDVMPGESSVGAQWVNANG